MTRPRRDIYPVFLPHAGCPFQCVYCNQHAVTSAGLPGAALLDAVEVRMKAYAEHVRRSGRPGEVAFYGGTFTALPMQLIERILSTAASHVSLGLFTGIRFSTRPDCLDGAVVRILAQYPVTTIELGAQSLSDRVLSKSRRGYPALTVREAAELVKERRWSLGIQLMAGLPGDGPDLFLESVKIAIDMGGDFLRFYPTLVLNGTSLADSYRRREYRPLSIEEAIRWMVPAYDLALEARIPVARMGLQPDPVLEKPGNILAGPYHPAFGYLVRCHWWRQRVEKAFAAVSGLAGSELHLLVPADKISDAVGEKRSNLEYWKAKWGFKNLRVKGSSELQGVEMHIGNDDCTGSKKLG